MTIRPSALIVLALPVLFAPACSKSEEKPAVSAGASTTVAASAGASTTKPAGAATAGGEVTAEKNVFTPEKVKVKAGEGVKFTNKDTVKHEPTEGTPEKSVDGGFAFTVAGGANGTTPALKAGTHAFFCAIHESMKGEITVE